MRIGTIIFTYNRSTHTKMVLEALKRNTRIPQKLYIFQDGLREGDDEEEWHMVNKLLLSIDWCEKDIIVANVNKGLAVSIVDGLNYAFKQCDAVIVLEDDCVPAPMFMEFMYLCLEKYENHREVYNVSGYDYFHGALDTGQQEFDAYFCGRSSSWGWGTWKNRWAAYEQDYTLIRQLKFDEELSRELYNWGSDLEEMLVGNVRGTVNSWAVFWSLIILKNRGRCVNPYKSLIRNVGFDGTGVHCGTSNQYNIEIDMRTEGTFCLPESIKYDETVRYEFSKRMGNVTAATEYQKRKKDAVIFGLGQFFFEHEELINKDYNIIGFVDNYKKGFFAGRKIMRANDLQGLKYDYIVLSLRQEILIDEIKEQLTNEGINDGKIIVYKAESH